MKIIKKFTCVFILIIKSIQYKLSKHSDSYWKWLYDNLERKTNYRFYDGCLIKFLFANACLNSFEEGICNVYESFRPGISDRELPANDLEVVFYSAISLNNKEVANRIIKIIKKEPDYFSSKLLGIYKSEYKKAFG